MRSLLIALGLGFVVGWLLKDILLNVHEQGQPNHFLMLHLPKFFLEEMDESSCWANVFLQAEERSGQFRLFRWPISPKSKEYYQK
jgi:hypothetical protein